MATQTMAIAPGNDIQLRGLGKNGVASMAVKKMMASRREKGTIEDIKEYPTGLKFWLIILTMTALLILGELDTSIVATALLRYRAKRQMPCSIFQKLKSDQLLVLPMTSQDLTQKSHLE
ncbi:unnamed protein product [Penicillium camemberti]|uniref:Str. FM013 n=1 Tax=Penicillium camemberti (strain FM 013) TaxID=1429867 RepID=A0A0G4PCZ1_PENC3|nr:unnamed protein product [Penicillium camemberti]